MPATVQDSANSTPFADVLGAVLSRLRAAFAQTGYVRCVAAPENRIPQYKAEEGVSVYVSSPQPIPKDGAGRYGRRTMRDVVVIVATQSLLDEAGSDEKAVLSHVALEESVANILEQVPPPTETYANRVGILIEWVGGGEDIVRQMKVDAGMLVSALRFRVMYTAPMKVKRA
jgi:hypothetical protein